MQKQNNRLLFGFIIIAIGLVALINNILFNNNLEELIATVLFYGVGLLLYSVYRQKKAVWLLFPIAFFFIIGTLILLDAFVDFDDAWFGVLLFYVVAAIFIYWRQRNKQWWPIIPAGACLTIGTTVLVDEFHLLGGLDSGTVFLSGIGLTFLYLWSIRNASNKLKWAIWPAVIILALAALLILESIHWFNDDYILPIILILIGLIIITTGIRKK